MKFFDVKTVAVCVATLLSMTVGRDFFFGMLLFLINLMVFKFVVKIVFDGNREEMKSVKNAVFLPVIAIKFVSVGLISYLVLVTAKGAPFWYVGGFGGGILLYTLGMLLEHRLGPRGSVKS